MHSSGINAKRVLNPLFGTMDLGEFSKQHELQAFTKPGLGRDDHEDAYVQIDEAAGLMFMPCMTDIALSSHDPNQVPPFVADDETAYLWLIRKSDLAVAKELSPTRVLRRNKHTNLSGGNPARCGGELRSVNDGSQTLYINGGSGRYSARSAQELDDALSVFEGYHRPVFSAGWDQDTDRPARWYRD